MNAELLTNVCGSHDMGFDGSFKPADLDALRESFDGLRQSILIHDRADSFELEKSFPQFLWQSLDGPFTDRRDASTGAEQATQELSLVIGKAGFDEDDVHGVFGDALGSVGLWA